MKRKFLLLVCAVLGGLTNVKAAYTDYLTGWTQITTEAGLQTAISNDSYFALVSGKGTDLMIKSMSYGSQNRLIYQSPTDPVIDNGFAWIIEYENSKYYLKNANSSSAYYGYTTSRQAWDFVASSDYGKKSDAYTAITVTISDNKFSLQTAEGGAESYIGPWSNGNWVKGERFAGNKSSENAENFIIYTISKADYATKRTALINAATAASGQNVTFLLPDANLDVTAPLSPWTGGVVICGLASKGSYVSEKYHVANTNIYQTISIPNGKYVVSAQGTYRQDDSSTDKAVLYVGDKTADLTSHSSIDLSGYSEGDDVQKVQQYLIDNPSTKATINDIIVRNSSLTLGIKTDAASADKLWVVYDNFQLTYYGNSVEAVATAGTFNPAASATSGTWYSVTTTKGYYDITASDAVTISYTQDATQDADDGSYSTMTFTEAGTQRVLLNAGTLYFKTGATKNITITSLGNGIQYYATELPGNGAMTAGQWYSFTIATAGYYDATASSDLSDIVYTTVGTTNKDNEGSITANFDETENTLLATTYYVKSTSDQTLTIEQSENVDLTSAITNPSFETGTPDFYKGWTVIVSSGSSTSDDQHRYKSGGLGDDSGSWRFYIWTSDAGAATIKQTLSDLPAGNYKLSAYMSSEKGDVFTLTAGSTSKKVIAGDGSATLVEVYFTQAVMGNVEISAKHSNAWFSLDNFHLIYNPSLPASLTEVSGKMSSTASTTQTTDVEAYIADRTFENLLTAQASMTAAVNSRVVYNNIATIRSNYETKAGALDDDGQDAYGTAINTASTGAETKYEAGDYETAAQAEEAYHRDYITAVKAQTTENTDMTEAIVNPSFESDLSTGWSTGDMGRQDNTAFDKKSGTYYVERYQVAGDKYIKQTLTGFHRGIYTLTAAAYANTNTTLAKLYVKVGGTESFTEVFDSKKDYSVSFNYDGTSPLEIGFFATLTSSGWVCVDNFRLTYDDNALPTSLDEVGGYMNADLKTAANTAISTYNSSNTIENYSAAQAAITDAEASRAVYVTINDTKTTYQGKADALDPAGQAAYTTAVNAEDPDGAATKYENGTYVTALEAELAFMADLATASKAQATAGADMTGAIINNSFETGTTDGWTYTTSNDHGAKLNSDNTYKMSNVDGSYLFNIWSTGNPVSQILTDMPAGTYRLTAVMGTDAGATLNVKLGDATGSASSVDKGTGVVVSVEKTLATAGNLTVEADAGGSQWYKVDNFRLTYLGVQKNVTVSAKAGKFGTVILPFAYDFAGDENFSDIEFYSCGSVTGSHLELEKVTTPAANTPYIIKNNGESNISLAISGYSDAALNDSYTVGNLTGVYTEATIAASDDLNSRYVLQTDESGAQAFYKVTSDFTATPYKCYLTVPTALGVKAFSLDIEDAIQSVEVIRSENAEIYNLAGQKMNKLQKGVNIVNGKKVLVK